MRKGTKKAIEQTAFDRGFSTAMEQNQGHFTVMAEEIKQLKNNKETPDRELAMVEGVCCSCSQLVDALAHVVTAYYNKKKTH